GERSKMAGEWEVVGFQSLFCWITLSGVGRLFEEEIVPEFQSLFCWITLSGLRSVQATGMLCRFNPCSAGSPSPAIVKLVEDVANVERFQSLFCWITLSGCFFAPTACLPQQYLPILSVLVARPHSFRQGLFAHFRHSLASFVRCYSFLHRYLRKPLLPDAINHPQKRARSRPAHLKQMFR